MINGDNEGLMVQENVRIPNLPITTGARQGKPAMKTSG